MKNFLFFLVWSLFLNVAAPSAQPAGSWMDAKIPSASPDDRPNAHVVALSALEDATAVNVEGPVFGGFREDQTPIVINVDFTIKRKRTIQSVLNLLVRANFHKGPSSPGQEGARATIFGLRFVVTTTHGGKIPFFLIEGDELRIDGLQTSVADKDSVFHPLHSLLLRLNSSATRRR